MKKIIDGVSYNTKTSIKVARSEYDGSEYGGPRGEQILYQTRGGAFFLHTCEITMYKDRKGDWQNPEHNNFEAMNWDDAHKWVMEAGQVELLSDIFGGLPEAADPSAWSATIYARVPLPLKTQVETLAKAAGLSVNSFVIRCLETCAATAP